MLRYDAIAVSSTDLTAGLDFFRQGCGSSLPWLSANIFTAKGVPIFPPFVIKKTASLTIGIIGLTGKAAFNQPDVIIGDWQAALAKQIQLLEHSCDLLLLLSNLSDQEHMKIAQDYPQIDLIIGGRPSGGNVPPKIFENCLLAQGGGRGKYIGKLVINWNQRGTWQPDPTKSLQQEINRLRSIDSKIEQLKNQQEKTGVDLSKQLKHLESSRETLAAQFRGMAEKTGGDTQATQANTYTSVFLPVRPSTTPADMQRIVLDVKQSTGAFNRMRGNTLPGDQTTLQRVLQTEAIGDYNGCRECHPRQADFWQETAHAKAYETLAKRGQSFNLDCLPCHVTGGSVVPGSSPTEKLYLLSLPENRRNITCAVCHGPARQHLLSPNDNHPIRSPDEHLCKICHTESRDEKFQFAVKLSKVACPTD